MNARVGARSATRNASESIAATAAVAVAAIEGRHLVLCLPKMPSVLVRWGDGVEQRRVLPVPVADQKPCGVACFPRSMTS